LFITFFSFLLLGYRLAAARALCAGGVEGLVFASGSVAGGAASGAGSFAHASTNLPKSRAIP